MSFFDPILQAIAEKIKKDQHKKQKVKDVIFFHTKLQLIEEEIIIKGTQAILHTSPTKKTAILLKKEEITNELKKEKIFLLR